MRHDKSTSSTYSSSLLPLLYYCYTHWATWCEGGVILEFGKVEKSRDGRCMMRVKRHAKFLEVLTDKHTSAACQPTESRGTCTVTPTRSPTPLKPNQLSMFGTVSVHWTLYQTQQISRVCDCAIRSIYHNILYFRTRFVFKGILP